MSSISTILEYNLNIHLPAAVSAKHSMVVSMSLLPLLEMDGRSANSLPSAGSMNRARAVEATACLAVGTTAGLVGTVALLAGDAAQLRLFSPKQDAWKVWFETPTDVLRMSRGVAVDREKLVQKCGTWDEQGQAVGIQ